MLADLVEMYDAAEDRIPLGWLEKGASFALVLDRYGYVSHIRVFEKEQEVVQKGGKTKTKMVPAKRKFRYVGKTDRRGSNLVPFFLIDNLSYLAGVGKNGKSTAEDLKKIAAAHAAAVDLHAEVNHEIGDSDYSAVCSFMLRGVDSFRKYPNVNLEKFLEHAAATGFGTFIVEGSAEYVLERPKVVEWMKRKAAANRAEDAKHAPVRCCLVSGEAKPTATVHRHGVFGLPGGPMTGSTLVGVNLESACSYGMQQADNSPVGIEEAEKISKMLNHLLSNPDTHYKLNDSLTLVFMEIPRPIGIVKNIVRAIRGEPLEFPDDLPDDVRVRVEGYSPNSARIFQAFDTDTLSAELFQARLQTYVNLFAVNLPDRPDGSPAYDATAAVPMWDILRMVLRLDRNYKDISPKNRNKPVDMNDVDTVTLTKLLEVMLVTNKFEPGSELYRRIQEGLNDNPDRVITSDRVAYALGIVNNKVPMKYVMLEQNGVDHACSDPGYLLGRMASFYFQTQEKYHHLQKALDGVGSGKKTAFRNRSGVSGEGLNGMWDEMASAYQGVYAPWFQRKAKSIQDGKLKGGDHASREECIWLARGLEKLHQRISARIGSRLLPESLTPSQRQQYRDAVRQQDFEFEKKIAFRSPPSDEKPCE